LFALPSVIVRGAHQSNAIDASANSDRAAIRNVQVNGNRAVMGQVNTMPSALIEMVNLVAALSSVQAN
jgi:hypothetical protein